jgi:hypothetical protein
MMSKHEEQNDRLEILENEKRLRDQGSTYMAHTHNDTGGRFSAISNPTVIGSTPTPASAYPAGNAWCDADQGLEPPLGYAIDAQEPPGPLSLSLDRALPSPSSQVPPLHEGLGFSQRAYRRF